MTRLQKVITRNLASRLLTASRHPWTEDAITRCVIIALRQGNYGATEEEAASIRTAVYSIGLRRELTA